MSAGLVADIQPVSAEKDILVMLSDIEDSQIVVEMVGDTKAAERVEDSPTVVKVDDRVGN